MSWWYRLARRSRMEEQLDKELRFHLEEHAADLMAHGITANEARRQARLALGGPEQVKEGCRDARGTRWLEDLAQDFRYAVRGLRRLPAFTAVALTTLALGIGATTLMFTLINGVLLKPLPYFEPQRLVRVHGYTDTWNTSVYGEQNLANPDFRDCQRQSHSLEIAGWLWDAGTISEPGDPEYVTQIEISSNMFSLLGVPLFRGRAFLRDEDRPGGAPVAILGYSLWQRRFAANPAVLGTTLVLNAKRYTVVGIASPMFRLDDDEGDVYTPIGQNTAGFMQRRAAHPVGVLGRLAPGAALEQAGAELKLIGRGLAAQYPDTNKGRGFLVQPLRPNVENVRSTLWLLLGAVGLVLLIACVNIASLLLARAVSRERELAMRVALGAGRGRLVRQCLTESAVLGLAGGALGVALAAAGLRPFVACWPGSLPRAGEVRLDWHVLLFAVAVSLASGVLFGLAPALRVPAQALEQVLRAGARTLSGTSRHLHGVFVVSEIALAVVLLVAAGMLGRALLRLSSLDPGVNIHNVLTARMALSPGTLANPARIRTAWQDVLERARALPGVRAIATIDTVPLRQGNNQIGYRTTPADVPENQRPLVLASSVSPDYLQVTGIPLRQGRFFTDQDRLGNLSVVVIDDVMARQAFGSEDPVGKHLWIDLGSDPVTVVGVVGHVRYWGLAGDDQARVRAQLYYPFAQVPDPLLRRWSELMSIAVRTDVAPLSIVEPLRRAVRGAGGDQVVYEVRTFDQLARASLDRQRFLLLLFGIFGGLALLLASIGIYGVLAYLTGRRVPEIGVRIALGATAADVVRMVMRQSVQMIGIGLALGLAASLAAARLLKRLVEGMQSTGPLPFAVMIAVLALAALLASFLPARRAGRVDPMRALRQE
jgi:predicted permease